MCVSVCVCVCIYLKREVGKIAKFEIPHPLVSVYVLIGQSFIFFYIYFYLYKDIYYNIFYNVYLMKYITYIIYNINI